MTRLNSRTAALLLAVMGAGCSLMPGGGAEPQATAAAPAGRAVHVAMKPAALVPEFPQERKVGELVYAGGFELTARDSAFGGISGLWVAPGGTHLVAVTDQGQWIDADLVLSGASFMGLQNVRMGAILDTDGRPVTGKNDADAEGLARDGGDFLVSFERTHRVLRFSAPEGRAPMNVRPSSVRVPGDVSRLSSNKSLEGIEVLGDRLVIFSEEGLDASGNILGWVGPRSGVSNDGRLSLAVNKPFAVTDLAGLPGGDLLVLERRFNIISGAGAQIRFIAGSQIRPGAVLDGPVIAQLGVGYTVDNMEGLAAFVLPGGHLGMMLVSDNNFNSMQRTLLMMFTLGPVD